MIKKLSVIVLILMTVAAGAHAVSAPAVRATADKKAIYIGDRIRYEIEVSSGQPLEIEWPKLTDYRIGDFEIKDSGKKDKKGLFGGFYVKSWYSITAYSLGKRAIPELEIKYRPKAAKDWSVFKTKAIDITIESVLTKEKKITDIRDIKGPIGFSKPYWVFVAAAAAIIAAAALIIYWVVNGNKPVRLPHETALEELEAIASELAKSGDVKAYYVRVSDCIRRYIERSFALKAPEMTTEEFLDTVKDSHSLKVEQKDTLKAFLGACDLVKFAKYNPAESEIGAVLSTARKFVEETKEASNVRV
jgi:hypothetical protein